MLNRLLIAVAFAIGLLSVAVIAPAQPATTTAPAGRVLAVLRDYESETPGDRGAAITMWSWTAEQKAKAAEFSRLQIVPDTPFGKRCARVTITDQLPWERSTSFRVLTIGPDYLPPTADAVRMRVKVLKGRALLTVGSPTVYFGHSDVSAAPVTVEPSPDGQWQTVEFSLHERLSRNFRRARFGQHAPVIHYTRWIQEPLYLQVLKGTEGEFLLDQIELIAHGQGRDYPTFAPDQVKPVSTIADFERPGDLDQAFTFLHEPADFTAGPKLPRASWAPPLLSRADGQAGGHALQIDHKGTEEVAFTGIKVGAVARDGANALAVTVRADHSGKFDEVTIDFIVYVTPDGKPFDYRRFAPPPAWKQQDPAATFDYYLSQQAMADESYGFYHARRSVPNGQWTRLVIPLADFTCAYGQVACAPLLRDQKPLAAQQITALALTPPYRHRSHATRLLIDDVGFVAVPGKDEDLRSFKP